jgi:hypothetical protein
MKGIFRLGWKSKEKLRENMRSNRRKTLVRIVISLESIYRIPITTFGQELCTFSYQITYMDVITFHGDN